MGTELKDLLDILKRRDHFVEKAVHWYDVKECSFCSNRSVGLFFTREFDCYSRIRSYCRGCKRDCEDTYAEFTKLDEKEIFTIRILLENGPTNTSIQ